PFQSASLHPQRSLFFALRQKIKCGTNPYQDRSLDAAPMFCHPILLFWCAETDPNNVWVRGIYRRNGSLVLLRSECPERRAHGAGDLEFGMTTDESDF